MYKWKQISSLINTTLTHSNCTFYLCFLTLAALDSKRILSESASLHIFHKCTKMFLLTVPSFNHLYFHRPRNYWHVPVRNNTVWAQPSYQNTNKHLGSDKLGEMTSQICNQAPKRYPKWRCPMVNFLLPWRGISLEPDALWKLKQRSVTQLSVVYLLVSTKNIRFLEWPPLKFNWWGGRVLSQTSKHRTCTN